jgi:hypothetical protein
LSPSPAGASPAPAAAPFKFNFGAPTNSTGGGLDISALKISDKFAEDDSDGEEEDDEEEDDDDELDGEGEDALKAIMAEMPPEVQ